MLHLLIQILLKTENHKKMLLKNFTATLQKWKQFLLCIFQSFPRTNHCITFSCPRVRYTIGISSSAIAPRFLRFPPTLHEIWNKEITEIYEKHRSNIEACE